MNKKRLLIVGDSFATDWRKKYKDSIGWPNMFENDFIVTNLAEAGVSEYKIYKQLKSVDINKFDFIIISHTSPYRIPIENHPVHKKDLLHNNCDIIYSDAIEHSENKIMQIAKSFYENIFYMDYFIFVNNLIFQEISRIAPNSIHITFFDEFYTDNILKFEKVFLNCKGNTNHLNISGNKIVYKKLLKILNEQN